jgi:hypothetical protein
VIGGNPTVPRWGEGGFDDEGVTRCEFGRLGEPLLRGVASVLPFAKAGPADDERPVGSAIG